MYLDGRLRHERGQPVERLRPAHLVQIVPSLGGEYALIENDFRSVAMVEERKRHTRLLVVRIRLLVLEGVHEALGRIDLRELPAHMELLSFGRLHREAVSPSSTNVEVDLSNGEPRGSPPLAELLGVHACREHTLSRRTQNSLEMERQCREVA